MFPQGATASGPISEPDRIRWLFVIASFFTENQRPLCGSTRKGFGEGGSYRSTPDTTARVPFRALETGGNRHGAVILTVSQIVSKGRKQGTGSPAIQLRLFDPNLFPEGQDPHPSKDVRKTSFYALRTNLVIRQCLAIIAGLRGGRCPCCSLVIADCGRLAVTADTRQNSDMQVSASATAAPWYKSLFCRCSRRSSSASLSARQAQPSPSSSRFSATPSSG
jgi:hypothetical protein